MLARSVAVGTVRCGCTLGAVDGGSVRDDALTWSPTVAYCHMRLTMSWMLSSAVLHSKPQ